MENFIFQENVSVLFVGYVTDVIKISDLTRK